MRSPNRSKLAVLLAGAALGVGAGAGGYAALDHSPSHETAAAPAPARVAPTATTRSSGLSVHAIYARDQAGVVEILARGQQQASAFPFGPSERRQAQGSGFVYDKSGHVITNEHVIDGASSLSVKFSDGTTRTAKVVGSDASTDVAVLDVNAPSSALHPLQLADSRSLAVGDPVVAIGSPLGLQNTVTTGIVSGLDRQIDAPNGFSIDNAIQTSAPITHGSSGGPLLDSRGDVVGVTSQIASETGGNEGIGFAVPSASVRSVAAQLIAGHKVEHAYLGVSSSDAANGRGAAVHDVQSGSPADRAGLKPGDVIVGFDGATISSSEDLAHAVSTHHVGQSVELRVRRGSQTLTLKATLANRPSQAP